MNEPNRTVVYFVRRWGWGSILALVLLRVAIGWHFYSEGTKKLAYNPATGETRVAFSSEGFRRGAVGPWAAWYRQDLPTQHDWERTLAVPREVGSTTKDEVAARKKWLDDYTKRRAAAEKAKAALPIEFPPGAPYYDWAVQIDKDWQATVAAFKGVAGLADEQKAAADAVYATRKQQLADYLAGEENSFADWQHQLWMLGKWEAADEAAAAGAVPFETARITEKRAETTAGSSGWVGQVAALDDGLVRDLRGLLTPEQATNAQTLDAASTALAEPKAAKLHQMDVAVTCLIIGVGACLILGLFTRLAALGGIAFLTTVVASQPPWVAGVTPPYYQIVEIAALLVVFAAGAGRWFGLDFFLRALFGKRRAAIGQTTAERS